MTHNLSVTFIPTIAMVLLAFTTILTINNLQQTHDTRTGATEHINYLSVRSISATAVAVSFRTNTPVKSSITIYGNNGYALTQDISEERKTTHAAVITGLPQLPSFRYEIALTDATGKQTRLTGILNTQ